MRSLTDLGWQRVNEGFEGSAPIGDERAFWEWAMTQGGGFQLAAYLIIGMLSGNEDECPGFNKVLADSHPARMAWSLDEERRHMISDFLRDPFIYIKTTSVRFKDLKWAAEAGQDRT